MEKIITPETGRGPESSFTGAVFVDPVPTGETSALSAARVTFTPGARTHWHRHRGGQTLHCVQGTGVVANRDGTVVVIRPGDTVWVPPGEEHWHGAVAGHLMSHLAMTELVEGEEPAEWLEPVDDDTYGSATAGAAVEA